MIRRQLALDIGAAPSYARADLLVAGCNRDAVAWLDRWPDWPAGALALHGPPGCGKTHLLEVWRAARGADARHVGLDDSAPVADEAALLHRYNRAREQGGTLLLAAREPPARWAIELPDLRSRLNAIPAIAIGAPDDALLAALLAKLFADRQLRVGQEVAAWLLPRMERSFAAARALVAALDEAALAERRNITVALARRVLEQSQQGESGWTSESPDAAR